MESAITLVTKKLFLIVEPFHMVGQVALQAKGLRAYLKQGQNRYSLIEKSIDVVYLRYD